MARSKKVKPKPEKAPKAKRKTASKVIKPRKPPRFPRVKVKENGLLELNAPPQSMRMRLATRNRKQSPLLRLPPELRHQVFSYVLGGYHISLRFIQEMLYNDDGSQIQVEIYTNSNGALHRCRPIRRPCFAFLRVSRQIYDETALIPYTLNAFGFRFVKDMRQWLRRRSLAQLSAITAVAFDLDFPREFFSVVQLYRMLPGTMLSRLSVLYVDMTTIIASWQRSSFRPGGPRELYAMLEDEKAELMEKFSVRKIELTDTEEGLEFARELGWLI